MEQPYLTQSISVNYVNTWNAKRNHLSILSKKSIIWCYMLWYITINQFVLAHVWPNCTYLIKILRKKNVCQGNTRTPNIRFYALAWLTVFKKVWNYGIQNNIVTIPTIMTYLTHIIFLRNSKFHGDSSYFHATYLIFTVNDSSYVLLNFALNFFLNFSTRIEWKFEWIMCGEFVWNSHLRY